MSDANIPADNSGEDSNNGAGQDQNPTGQPPQNDNAGKDNNIDPAEKARREQQSAKDKARAENEDQQSDLEYLKAREAVRERDEYVSDFLTKNKEKYPNVEADDLKFAGSPAEVEELATHLQNRYKSMRNAALDEVQGTEDKPLSKEQIAEAEEALEKEALESGKSQFGGFLNLQRKKRR